MTMKTKLIPKRGRPPGSNRKMVSFRLLKGHIEALKNYANSLSVKEKKRVPIVKALEKIISEKIMKNN